MRMKNFFAALFFGGVASLFAGSISAQDLKYPIGEGAYFHWDNLEAFQSMDLASENITVFGPWLGQDKELIESVFDYFRHATGASIDYAGSDDFEQQILIDIEAGSPPNVVIFPQPGLAADMARRGKLVPLGSDMADWVASNYAAGPSWVELGTYANAGGKQEFYGFFYKVDVKSLVWYVPQEFEDNGYEVPQTMEELLALSDKMAADGTPPWCIGLGSGGATGWPATDWVEDIMLRTQPPSVYDGWVTNEIPFNDSRIVEAIETFGRFARREATFVQGGAQGVAATDFRDSPKGMFAIPPACYMHRQASFISSFLPEGTVLGEDVDFFYFPPFASQDLGNPVLGAGTLWAIAKDSAGSRALLEFLKTPLAHEIWMNQSGFLTPHKGVHTEAYANSALKKQGEILLNATTFRFDGSDLMPGAVGAGSFWKGMVDYVNGSSAQEVADAIQESWDAIGN